MLEVLEKEYTQSQTRPAEASILGLSQTEAEQRLKTHGRNALSGKKKSKPVKIFLGQFKDVMVLILLAATVVSVLLGEITDAVTIILIVLIDAVLGFIQEFRTEKTLEMLSKMTAPTARCYRDGVLQTLPAENLVPGDVVELEAGDRVPADCVLVLCKGLFADESILTGESVPVEKQVGGGAEEDSPASGAPSLGKKYLVYSGAIITKGHGRARVIATGPLSQMGKISTMLTNIEEEATPLQKKLGELGRVVAIICLVVCVVVFGAGVLRGEPVFDMLLTGISIAIAAIPEGLPATVTIALALAVSRMLKQNALVHKLHAVETLGCASVICSDKTGTITENQMTVTRICAGGSAFHVTGNGRQIAGELLLDGGRVNPASEPALQRILTAAALCETAEITPSGVKGKKPDIASRDRGRLSVPGVWEVTGDPTETALLIAAAKGGIRAEDLETQWRKADEIPFDSDTRCMSVLCARAGSPQNKTVFAKGALDVILTKCSLIRIGSKVEPLTYSKKKKILEENDQMADEALRVLAFAEKDAPTLAEGESGMVFLGLIGMIDPPRKEAVKAIKTCARAHIKTVMITGDHKNTAAAIARQAGILKGDPAGRILTGQDLELMSDEDLAARIENIRVFARVSPSHKLRIVRAFKAKGHIVTMTGDGVNDAPAVKEANIGVSMGITGTDVTKQAADVILLDDNFATLVSAVEQGRTIYANIRKFVRYLLSCNIGEVITMFLGILMGLPLVLLPTQILLVNLVTDGLPAIALGVEPSDGDLMSKRPRSPEEGLFSGGLMGKIVFRGIFIGLCTLGCFTTLLRMGGTVAAARTGALFTLVVSQLIHVFECKSEERNIFTVPYWNNWKLVGAVLASALTLCAAIYFPPLQAVFETLPLNRVQILTATGFSACVPVLYAIFGGSRKKKEPPADSIS